MSDDKYNEYNDDSNRYEDDQGPTPPGKFLTNPTRIIQW